MRDFHKTIDILVKAYLNNTLKHSDCKFCAVGNILGCPEWSYLFITMNDGIQYSGEDAFNFKVGCRNLDTGEYIDSQKAIIKREIGREAIKESGYTIEELARIEYAFEIASKGRDEDEYMFNGLMDVVNVLADIHGIDLEIREGTKKLFKKPELCLN